MSITRLASLTRNRSNHGEAYTPSAHQAQPTAAVPTSSTVPRTIQTSAVSAVSVAIRIFSPKE